MYEKKNENNLENLVTEVHVRHDTIQVELESLLQSFLSDFAFTNICNALDKQNKMWRESILFSSHSYQQWCDVQRTMVRKMTEVMTLIGECPMTQIIEEKNENVNTSASANTNANNDGNDNENNNQGKEKEEEPDEIRKDEF